MHTHTFTFTHCFWGRRDRALGMRRIECLGLMRADARCASCFALLHPCPSRGVARLPSALLRIKARFFYSSLSRNTDLGCAVAHTCDRNKAWVCGSRCCRGNRAVELRSVSAGLPWLPTKLHLTRDHLYTDENTT